MAPTHVNPLDILAIQNTLSRYVEALDNKLFDLLDKVFSRDVVANYPFNPELRGIDEIRSAIQNRLGPIKTHHNLTSRTLVFSANGRTANAVTMFVGIHLGQGPHDGKELKAYGRYVDELVCQPTSELGDYEGVQGASGIWRIAKRTVAFTGRVGDERIMSEF